MKKLKEVLANKDGNSTPLMIVLVLVLLLLSCAISEYLRLNIIVKSIRDAMQTAVISVSTCNYDELYNGLREGYSGGYTLSNGQWKETLDYGDVYAQLDSLLGLETKNGYHIKTQDSGYEYRLSRLNINLQNTSLSPGNTSKNFEADVRIQLEVPLSFGWELLPPLKMAVRTQAGYTPKF